MRNWLTPQEILDTPLDVRRTWLIWHRNDRVSDIMPSKARGLYNLYQDGDFCFASIGKYELLEVEPLDYDDIRQRCRLLLEFIEDGDLVQVYDHLRGVIQWQIDSDEYVKGLKG